MSEPGWREFVSADDIDDWVVLHEGPTAVFRVASLVEAARLATAVAEVPGLDPRKMLTVSADFLTVKLTREVWGTEPGTSMWLGPSRPLPARSARRRTGLRYRRSS